MDFPPYLFHSSFQGFHRDQPLFADFDPSDGNINDMELVGAEVLHHSMAYWSHPAMQRFLKDNHRPMMFNPMPQSQSMGFGMPVAPMPPGTTHHFHESPPSSQDQSSCSSARSPRVDTDMVTGNAPSTPPDMSFVSSLQNAPFDPFDLHSQHFLTGMGDCPRDTLAGVSMADINPAEDIQSEWEESPHIVDFTSPPQLGFNSDSHSIVAFEMDARSSQPPTEQSYHGPGSPEVITTTKVELSQAESTCLFDAMKGSYPRSYPTPSIGESEDLDADIDVASPAFEDDDYDDDGDDEYQPSQKQASPTFPREPNNTKRTAPIRPLDRGLLKKQKAALTAPQSARPLPSSSGSRITFSCSECSASFKDEILLQSHIKKTHTRPFICVFRFAGCPSTFASKNEWKRHVMSQHLVLTYWLCDIDICAHNKNTPSSHSTTNSGRSRSSKRTAERMITLEPIGPPLPNGAIFNRKDLYTQHLRRMHTPSTIKRCGKTSNIGSDTSSGDWEEQIKSLQSSALRERCKLPSQMQCPANQCELAFSGADAWDQRMEHVAKHLEKAAIGAEDPVVFGGPTDPSLMDWVNSAEVAVVREVDPGKWVLNNPLRSASEGRGVGRRRGVSTSSVPPGSVVGTSRTMSLSFSPSTPAAVALENDETVIEEGEEDAEGEEEY